MTKFSRCPKCASLYDLRTVDLSPSGGWVQCGDCGHKFKAATYEVDQNEISFHHTEDKTIGETAESDNGLAGLVQRESEFSEKSITMEVSTTASHDEQENDHFKDFVEELLEPEMFVKDADTEISSQTTDHVTTDYTTADEEEEYTSRKKSYSESRSEFSEELLEIKPKDEKQEQSFFDKVEEESVSKDRNVAKFKFSKVLWSFIGLLALLVTCAILAIQTHSRGIYEWIPSQQYEKLLSVFPQLSKLEKNQFDLSKLHLASVRMEPLNDGTEGHRISLQLINKSRFNQAYPDFQIEFTDAQGQVIARTLILPNTSLEQGTLEILESKEAKTLYFDFLDLPEGAAGYEINIVNPSS